MKTMFNKSWKKIDEYTCLYESKGEVPDKNVLLNFFLCLQMLYFFNKQEEKRKKNSQTTKYP